MQPEGDGGLDAMGDAETRTQRGLSLRHAGRGRPRQPGRPFIPPCRTRDRVGHRPGTTGAAADGRAGVGGLHTSEDVGERRWPPDPAEQRRHPCWCELSKGPMTGALTSGLMSPDHSKGSGPGGRGSLRCWHDILCPCLGFASRIWGRDRHEPHQPLSKSRMVETSAVRFW